MQGSIQPMSGAGQNRLGRYNCATANGEDRSHEFRGEGRGAGVVHDGAVESSCSSAGKRQVSNIRRGGSADRNAVLPPRRRFVVHGARTQLEGKKASEDARETDVAGLLQISV